VGGRVTAPHEWTQALFADLTAAIAAELGLRPAPLDPDEVAREYTHRDIVAADGTGYSLSPPCYGDLGRISIQPIWPMATTYSYGGGERPSCTVDAARPPRAIAADITRKLAGGYAATLAKIAAHDQAAAEDRAARDALAGAITAIMGGRAVTGPDWGQSWNQTRLSLPGPGYAGFAAEFSGDGGEVLLGNQHGIRVPAPVALDMLRVWAGWALPALAAEEADQAAQRQATHLARVERARRAEAEAAKTPVDRLLDRINVGGEAGRDDEPV
jgi:hypothetical protein